MLKTLPVFYPSRDPPGGFGMLIARLRGKVPKDTCLVVFERPDKEKPVVFRTYVNGEHDTNFTHDLDLLTFLWNLRADIPNIQIYVRCTRKHMYPYTESKKITKMLEFELWRMELLSSYKGGLFPCP